MILRNHRHPSTSYLIVGLAAVSAYIVTLIGEFTFDDNFAVVRAWRAKASPPSDVQQSSSGTLTDSWFA